MRFKAKLYNFQSGQTIYIVGCTGIPKKRKTGS